MLVHILASLLQSHPERTMVEYLVAGFSHGFAIGFRGIATNTTPTNLASSRHSSAEVSRAVATEVSRGHTAGPFVAPPFPITHCSPLGATPKPDGSIRLILDLSQPRGLSVNEGIDKAEFSVRYSRFDDAVALVEALKPGAFMAKADIKHAFRLCPVRSADWHLLCFKWEGHFYVDVVLPFGCRSSPFIFNTFADALQWICVQVGGLTAILHYLDDFFFTRASASLCQHSLDTFIGICGQLHVPLAPEKIVHPTRVIQYLGIIIDSQRREIRLPDDKMDRLMEALPKWHDKRKCTKRELLSLIGVLSFACRVVKPGRIFLRRLIDLATQAQTLNRHLDLNAEARADIAWWMAFLPDWNGRALFQAPPVSADSMRFATDASGLGLGAVFGKKWPPQLANFHINIKELFAIVAAVHAWADQWRDLQLVTSTDNMAIVQVWLSGTCKSPPIMALVRRFFFFLARRNLNLTLTHIPGKLNIDADLCSRLQVQKFLHGWEPRTTLAEETWGWLSGYGGACSKRP